MKQAFYAGFLAAKNGLHANEGWEEFKSQNLLYYCEICGYWFDHNLEKIEKEDMQ